MNYNGFVGLEVAKKLKEIEYCESADKNRWFYNEDGSIVSKESAIGAYDNAYIKERFVYLAPTYATIFDWLANVHGSIISMTPWPTFAFEDRTAYSYTISRYNEESAKFDRIVDEEMGSFALEADTAILKAIEMLEAKEKVGE